MTRFIVSLCDGQSIRFVGPDGLVFWRSEARVFDTQAAAARCADSRRKHGVQVYVEFAQ